MAKTSSTKSKTSKPKRQNAPRTRRPGLGTHDRDLRSYFQPLRSQAPISFWTTDRDLRLTSAWGALNLIPQHLVGKLLCEQRGVENSVTAHLGEYYQALQGQTVSFYIDHPRKSFHVTLAPLRGDRSTRVAGVIGTAMDVTEQRRSESEIRYIADHDPLTGLSNSRVLLGNLDSELRRSDRTERPFALLLLDVDALKAINDRHGHLVGSRVLCRLAAALRKTCRSIDTTARYGGDEFAVLLLETNREAAEHVAARITSDLTHDPESPSFTASVGLAVFPGDGFTTENLLGAADRDLYRNKLRAGLQGKRYGGEITSADQSVPLSGPERRRSERRVLDVPLVVSGETTEQKAFREQTFTVSVNAHGALVVLAASVTLGQKLLLRNPDSERETEARVVRFGAPYGGLAQVGVEFARPAPDFWPLEAPPQSWTQSLQGR